MSRRPPQQPKRRGTVSPLYVAAAVLIAVAVVGSLIFLSTPRPVRVQDISGVPSRGSELGEATAKVTITEYSDFR
jgi:hypothetical protein